MAKHVNPADLPEDVARFAAAQIASGRFASVGEVLVAGVEALRSRDATDGERAQMLRAAWDDGKESMRQHGPQLETDEEFESFLDECETNAARQ